MFIKTTLIALTLAVSAAPMAFAKGHSQSINNPDPEYREEGATATVRDAQTLGQTFRGTKGFNNTRQ